MVDQCSSLSRSRCLMSRGPECSFVASSGKVAMHSSTLCQGLNWMFMSCSSSRPASGLPIQILPMRGGLLRIAGLSNGRLCARVFFGHFDHDFAQEILSQNGEVDSHEGSKGR
jgi:hypothetical protein